MDEKRRVREWFEKTFDLSWKDELELWLAWGVLQRKAGKMYEILKQFWTDPAYATSAIRTIVGVVCNLIISGQIVLPGAAGKWAWTLAQLWPLILMKPAGQTNQTDKEIKAISHDSAVPPPTIGDHARD